MDGKPKMVGERYLGSAVDIEALLDAREDAVRPERTRHLAFGDVAAVWGFIQRLGVVEVIDEVAGARRSDAGASVGTLLALAAMNRLVDPCSKRAFADWWKTTAADRFTKISAAVLDHRRFWDAMHAITLDDLAAIEQAIAARMVTSFGVDISALALDMTNFATYIDTGNDKAPIAARGKAKQKRSRPAPGRARPGRHPRRRNSPGLPRLRRQPTRRHPVRHHDRPAGRPARRPCRTRRHARRGPDDGGVRRRTELGGQLRPPGPIGAGVRGLGSAVRLRRSARPARRRPGRGGRRPVRRADRAADPPRGLRRSSGAPCSPTHPPCTRPSPAASTRPWPRPRRDSPSWPTPWPAVRPAAATARSPPRSTRSSKTPGYVASSPGS